MPKGKPRSEWDPARGRNGPAWKRVKDALLVPGACCEFAGCACPWGREIDQTLPRNHRWSGTVDHIVALTESGHPTDLQNAQVMHRSCNSTKENERRRALKAATQAASKRKRRSRDW